MKALPLQLQLQRQCHVELTDELQNRILVPEVSALSLMTSYTTKTSKGDVLHHFGHQALVNFPTALCTYELTITADAEVELRIFNRYRCDLLEPALELRLEACQPTTVNAVDLKTWACYTNEDCLLTILVLPREKTTDDIPPVVVVSRKGHQRLCLKSPSRRAKELARQSHERAIVVYSNPSKTVIPTLMVNGLKYYYSLNSLITLSIDLDNHLSYLPYSIKICNSSPATLHYRIITSPSSGEGAHVTVTAIETISAIRYGIVADSSNKALVNHHQGSKLEGSFALPLGLSDVGLHLYCLYGFSVDVGQNPATDLARFEVFQVTYAYAYL